MTELACGIFEVNIIDYTTHHHETTLKVLC